MFSGHRYFYLQKADKNIIVPFIPIFTNSPLTLLFSFFVNGLFMTEGSFSMKHCLTIAGSDCSGGAGIQADLKTFAAHGVFGMSVIVSVVAENTSRVISIHDVPQQSISEQLDAVFEDIPVHAVKVGMLSNQAAMQTVAEKLTAYHPPYIVFDPVMAAKGGHALMQLDALSTLKNQLLPLTTLLTPNILEAEILTQQAIHSEADMRHAAQYLHELGAANVLIKGGHAAGDPVDILYDGENYFRFPAARIPTKNTHGTGCTLSSAIAANLAQGLPVPQAVETAKQYITNAIKYSLDIGKGHGPTNHFYEYYQMKGLL